MLASANMIWLCDGTMCREMCICRDASVQGLVSQSACTVALHDTYSSMPFKRTFSPKNNSMLGFILWNFDELTFCYNFSKSVCFCARSLGTLTRKVLWQQKKQLFFKQQNQHLYLWEVHVFICYFWLRILSCWKHYGSGLCWHILWFVLMVVFLNLYALLCH